MILHSQITLSEEGDIAALIRRRKADGLPDLTLLNRVDIDLITAETQVTTQEALELYLDVHEALAVRAN